MLIHFSPQRSDETLLVDREGDALWINGQAFDLSPLPEGAELPAEATGSAWFVGAIRREAGELVVTLRLPHGPSPSEAVAFPQSVHMTEDGPVPVPADEPPPADPDPLDEVPE